MADTSTIYALSSGSVPAGIAVIRISGPRVLEIVKRMAAPEVRPRQAALRRISHPKTALVLDQALVLYFAAPQSETGEDVAEFQLHGGPAVVRAVLEALGTFPTCRMAEPGEFARRAFLHGKLNLVEVEALADLVAAETEAQRALALQSASHVSRQYEAWRRELVVIAGLCEAAIDFSDEGDVSAQAYETARQKARPLLHEIAQHLNDGHRGEILRHGFRVALLGPPNAGKSSLLNLLAQRDVAIVSEEAGTTRDVIEVKLDLGGLPVVLFDTAGIRETAGPVEREGIRRSLEVSRKADLTLWLSETGDASWPADISRETCWPIRTKADLMTCGAEATADTEQGTPVLKVSAKTGAGIDQLIARLAARAGSTLQTGGEFLVSQARHREQLSVAQAALKCFIDGSEAAIELRAEDVRQAVHALGRLTGRVDVEEVLDEIFGQFCIGK